MKNEKSHIITPEKAASILAEGGLKVTVEQAKLIVKFLSGLAEISLDTYMGKSK